MWQRHPGMPNPLDNWISNGKTDIKKTETNTSTDSLPLTKTTNYHRGK